MRIQWSRAAALLAAAAALAVVGCGGNDDDDGSASTTSSAPAASAPEELVPAPPTTPTTDIVITEPLAEAPPKKSVIWLQCELPVCARYAVGFKDAAAALGWSLKTIVYKSASPAAALEQAVAQRPDFISITGIPSAAMKPELAAAKRAGIPVLGGGTVEKPPESPFTLMTAGTLQPDAEAVAHWMINDSQGEANVVGVSIPQFPILNSETDWLATEFMKLCSGCSYASLNITVDDIGAGTVAQKLIGYLQSHPDVNYMFFTFSDPVTGLPAQLQAAGLADKVKIVGVAGNESIYKDIFEGKQAAWTTAGVEWDGWVHLDAMARLANGEELSQEYIDAVYTRPEWVVTNTPEAQKAIEDAGGEWNGPVNFQESFKKLWKVK